MDKLKDRYFVLLQKSDGGTPVRLPLTNKRLMYRAFVQFLTGDFSSIEIYNEDLTTDFGELFPNNIQPTQETTCTIPQQSDRETVQTSSETQPHTTPTEIKKPPMN